MGKEYFICCNTEGLERSNALLPPVSNSMTYELHIEERGILFVDYGSGSDAFQRVIDFVLHSCGSVVIEEI